MAKKKATMSLKDFHGGSIPSDLPLPSAPGVIMRSSDHAGYERQTLWGNSMGKPDHRLRPGSAGAIKTFDDKTLFLNNSQHIGRNFDEDERKPLDGVSAPRRTVSDGSLCAVPNQMEPKQDYSSSEGVPSWAASAPVSQLSSCPTNNSYAVRFTDVNHVGSNSPNVVANSSYPVIEGSRSGANYQNVGGHNRQSASGSDPHAWGLRKEAVGVAAQVQTGGSAPDPALKLACASALEKVSSGRWHTKQPTTHHSDVEVIRYSATENECRTVDNNLSTKSNYDVAGWMGYVDMKLAKGAERSLTVDDGIYGGEELSVYETARSSVISDAKERNSSLVQHAHNSGKFGGSELQSTVPLEPSERHTLNLLPRSKLLENIEPPVDYKQLSDSGWMENLSESHEIPNPAQPAVTGYDHVNRAVEHPKLNLKSRSHPFEQSERNFERERDMLFGSGRPREMVLKERGIDGVAVSNNDPSQPANRVKQDLPKTDRGPKHGTAMRYNGKVENIPINHRIGKNIDRRDHRVDIERTDVQRRNWRSENWRNGRGIQKQHQHHPQDRECSPGTWLKPVEQPKPSNTDVPAHRYGKAASALELAQAFSRSVSDPKATDSFPGQRGLSSVGQKPFSRLMGPAQRPRINGY